MKSPITTHVLDTGRGRPAAGVQVTLDFYHQAQGWRQLATGFTDADGRLTTLLPHDSPLARGVYRLTFQTDSYFKNQQVRTFYPSISIVFEVDDPHDHYHVPLLLSSFGYTTYRGS
jgi:5-hydroxyisourate hydrolase